MKITRNRLQHILIEFLDVDKQNQTYNNVNKKLLQDTGKKMYQENKTFFNNLISDMSQDLKSGIIAFYNLDYKKQTDLLFNGLKRLEESKNNRTINDELYDHIMGNPEGIRKSSELKKLTDSELFELWESVSWSRLFRNMSLVSFLLGLSFLIYIIPPAIQLMINSLYQVILPILKISLPMITVPIFSKAAFIILIFALCYALYYGVTEDLQNRSRDFNYSTDREKTEAAISDALYLNDDSGKINMFIKNLYRLIGVM